MIGIDDGGQSLVWLYGSVIVLCLLYCLHALSCQMIDNGSLSHTVVQVCLILSCRSAIIFCPSHPLLCQMVTKIMNRSVFSSAVASFWADCNYILVACNSKWATSALHGVFLNIHQRGLLTVLFGCLVAATWNCCCLCALSVYTRQPCLSLQCY